MEQIVETTAFDPSWYFQQHWESLYPSCTFKNPIENHYTWIKSTYRTHCPFLFSRAEMRHTCSFSASPGRSSARPLLSPPVVDLPFQRLTIGGWRAEPGQRRQPFSGWERHPATSVHFMIRDGRAGLKMCPLAAHMTQRDWRLGIAQALTGGYWREVAHTEGWGSLSPKASPSWLYFKITRGTS